MKFISKSHQSPLAQPPEPPPTFEQELTRLLNKHNKDTEHGTPDFILAKFLVSNLDGLAVVQRQGKDWRDGAEWYDFNPGTGTKAS